MKFEIVAGWTESLDFDLLADGDTPEGTLDGDIELILKKADGTQMDTTGDVAIQDATTWRVRYTPDTGDLVAGTYRGRFKRTSVAGKVSYFPSKAWDDWIIRSEA